MAAKASNVKVRLEPNTNNTLLATWDWSKSHTKNYEYKWQYLVHYYNKKTKKWENVWLDGSTGSATLKNTTYTIPDEALQVRFTVKPVSTTHKVKKKDKAYWTAGWSSWVAYNVTNMAPDLPPVPNVQLNANNTKITVYVNIDVGGSSINRATKIHFELYNVTDSKAVKTNTPGVNQTTGRAATSFDLTNGKKYRVRCQAEDSQGQKSGWTVYTPYTPDAIIALPASVTKFTTCKLSSIGPYGTDKRVELGWAKPSGPITGYEIQYANKQEYFDQTDYPKTVNIDDSSITSQIFDIQEDNTLFGNLWYFRIRAKNDTGYSSWSEIASLVVGTEPEAPTTWALASTVEVGENVTFNWVHNTTDGSKEESAKLWTSIIVPGGTEPIVSEETIIKDPSSTESISSRIISTDNYPNGATIEWKVKTKGIYSGGSDDGYGEYSISRTINVVARPTLEVVVSESNNWYWDNLNFDTGNVFETEGEVGNDTDILTSYPFYISALAGPNSQKVLRWYLEIIFDDDSIESYESFAEAAVKIINKGDIVYSRHFDGDDDNKLFLTLNAIDVALENNMRYLIKVRVVMDTGLSAEVEKPLTIALDEDDVDISAAITVDNDNAAAYIRPWATNRLYYGTAVLDNGVLKFQPRDEETLIPFESTAGLSEGDDLTVYIIDNIALVFDADTDDEIPIDNVYFSVYRINYDGTFTEIQSRIDSAQELTVIDLHPALDYARYRIIAISKETGKAFYEDFSEPVEDDDIIVQWANEPLNDFIINENGDVEEFQEFSGEFLRLPWNIDTSEAHAKDNALVEYIGRKHPVSYYGTQLGETATWNTDVDKEDTETIYALRRLAIYQGDVYVREPSGVGYWAQISVSMNNTHAELVIPVTLTITRVEGGA